MSGRPYLERGLPVLLLLRWGPNDGDGQLDGRLRPAARARRGPRNVLVRHADHTETVRPFRGLRRFEPCRRCRGHGYIIETWTSGTDTLLPETASAEFACGARFPFHDGERHGRINYEGCKIESCHRCGGPVYIGEHVCEDCALIDWHAPVTVEPRGGTP